ncbi:hypothetical protein [Derxia lacustris]|uniref:hypothetical protein n=1 Tax=Derxia lacustris TaxID=764842 RepID=UPI00111C4673|nr:hypothetical protein [Derxia lacustris]
MTLCVVWRKNDEVHFASDSRVTLAKNSHADVGIKVLSLPYNIYSPCDSSTGKRSLVATGELGMCFAGSAVNSLFVKESVAEVLKELQYAPGYSNTSMNGLAQLVFTAYRLISKEVCSTVIGGNGRAALVIAGWCIEKKCVRTFYLETSDENKHSCKEILTAPNQHHFIGSGKSKAGALLPMNPSDTDYLRVLKSVIDDPTVDSVGGSIQYGHFENNNFKLSGIVERKEGVHYWRGALDLNSTEFMGADDILVPSLSYIDPFNTFSR